MVHLIWTFSTFDSTYACTCFSILSPLSVVCCNVSAFFFVLEHTPSSPTPSLSPSPSLSPPTASTSQPAVPPVTSESQPGPSPTPMDEEDDEDDDDGGDDVLPIIGGAEYGVFLEHSYCNRKVRYLHIRAYANLT